MNPIVNFFRQRARQRTEAYEQRCLEFYDVCNKIDDALDELKNADSYLASTKTFSDVIAAKGWVAYARLNVIDAKRKMALK